MLAQITAVPGETETTMLSVAAHERQAYVRRSKLGLSGSRSERIIGASQSAQNGYSLCRSMSATFGSISTEWDVRAMSGLPPMATAFVRP
jgi:hypothetical protein